MASTLLELSASHALWMACVVRDACRSDSRTLDEAAEACTDADTDARYTGAWVASTLGVPFVTLVHPTTIIAHAARLPTASAAIRTRWGPRGLSSSCPDPRRGVDNHPISTVCRRYRCVRPIAGSSSRHHARCMCGTIGGR